MRELTVHNTRRSKGTTLETKMQGKKVHEGPWIRKENLFLF